MGLLEKLWDDTVAGPRPDSGLGKLRKYDTFNFRSSSGKDTDESNDEAMKVTRSIMIVKPPGVGGGRSAPASPAGSTPPASPFAGSRGSFRLRRRSSSDAYEKASKDGPRSLSST